jgi:hypothetical protein
MLTVRYNKNQPAAKDNPEDAMVEECVTTCAKPPKIISNTFQTLDKLDSDYSLLKT